MALRDYTKRLFADALEELMRTTPLEKIRVGALCAHCGAQRQTFYYHFRDKYDLVAWMYLQDCTSALGEPRGACTEARAAEALRRVYARRDFYRKAFRSRGEIAHHLYRSFVSLGRTAARRHLGREALDTATDYAIKSHAFACVGHTLEWLEGTSGYSPEEFAHLQFQFLPALLKEAWGIES